MARLSLPALEAFVAAVRCGSMSAAARKLGCSKAAISIAIKRLEHELGTALLVTTGRRREMSLTAAGRTLFARAVPALERLHAAVEEPLDGDSDDRRPPSPGRRRGARKSKRAGGRGGTQAREAALA